MYSKVIIVGNIVRDSEIKYSQNGTAVVSNAIAYSTGFGDRKETSFIDFVIFGKLGESLVKYLLKGSKVLVEGELKQEQFVDKQGAKRSKFTVVVKEIRLLNEKPQGTQNNSYNNPQQNNYNNNPQQNRGYNNNYNQNNNPQQNAPVVDIDESQIPF